MHRVIFSSLVVGCFAAVQPVPGQTRGDTVSVVPGPLADRIAAEIAGRWRVEPKRIVLEWSRFGDRQLLTDTTPFAVRGQPGATRFAVVFSPPDEPPLAAGLRVGVHSTVALAARPLMRGETVGESDVRWGDVVLWGGDALRDGHSELPIGWTIRTNIRANERIAAPAAIPPPAVRAGEDIDVVWTRGRVVISLQGTAMNNAAPGEYVRVRLKNRRGNARGIASGPGRVDLVEKNQ